MKERLSPFGVGPLVALGAGVAAGLAAVATRLWPAVCPIEGVPYAILLTVGLVLVVLGGPLWLGGAVAAMSAYRRDELVTAGVFGLVRHPIYAAWIILILPGIALTTGAWPFLAMPLAGWLVFKLTIRREDEYLEKRFGQAYRSYRARVNELLPIPRIGQR